MICKLFYLHAHGPGFSTQEPVNKIEELSGLRIKSDANTSKWSPPPVPTYTMPMLETYDALKRGIADESFSPLRR